MASRPILQVWGSISHSVGISISLCCSIHADVGRFLGVFRFLLLVVVFIVSSSSFMLLVFLCFLLVIFARLDFGLGLYWFCCIGLVGS